MESAKKRILRQHFFEQIELARQELYVKEQYQQERLKRELSAKIRRQQLQKQQQQFNQNRELLPKPVVVSPPQQQIHLPQSQSQITFQLSSVPPQGNFSQFHQNQQLMHEYQYYYHYQHQQQPYHQIHQSPQIPRPLKIIQTESLKPTKKVVAPVTASKVRGPLSLPPAAGVHGIDRTGHDYINGEYFCVCGAQFSVKKDLFGHIREMCKIRGTWISCNF